MIVRKEKALNPTVIKLGLVSLFADISSEMLYPITPIFLTTVLGASMASVGFIEGMAEAIASLLKTFSGAWSDRLQKRRPFVAGGYLLAALAKPLLGAVSTWPQALLARGLDRTGKGLRSAPRDAMLADAVPPHLRGAAFGWHRGMDTLGAAIGPLLALFYLSASGDALRKLYYWALIPGLIAVAISLTIKDSRTVKPRSETRAQTRGASLSKNYYTFLISWTVFSLANSSDVFLLMKAKSVGLSTAYVIALYCFYNLMYALLSPYLGSLSDRIGRKRLLAGGLGAFALVYVGFAYARVPWEFWVLFAAYGAYMAATDGAGKALAIDLGGADFKATSVGILGTATGLSALVASILAGQFWDRFSPQATFFYGAGGAVLAGIILLAVREGEAA